MSHLIFQPAGNQGGREHYRDTIENPVPFARIAKHVDRETLERLRAIYGGDAIPTWGATPGANDINESKWKRIEPGDITLFLKDGKAFASAAVTVKTRSPALARDLWGANDDDQTWELIYFLKDVTARDIAYDRLNVAAGYEAANRFQGFAVLDEERSREALAALGLPSQGRHTGRVWWVNQGATNTVQREGGFLWAPTHDRRGVEPTPWKNVMALQPGDVVLHYASGIRYVSRVLAPPTMSPRPSDFPAETWQENGYRAELHYRDIQPPVELDAIPISWRTEEAQKSPGPSVFNRNGGVVQSYLFSLSETFVARMRERFPQLFEEDPVQQSPRPTPPVIDHRLAEIAPMLERDFQLAGFLFPREDLTRFVAALMAKPFVILTGLSGSGKTKIAQGFAYWLGCTAANELCAVVAVGPDWTSKESALGFLNALDPSDYSKPKPLKLMLHARAHAEEPHFLILDEMNLSHVERYFADILSAMESGEDLDLHNGAETLDVPRQMALPANLFIVGTVNVDETTYMFSPKVLDRANVLEFRADSDLMRKLMAPAATRPDLAVLMEKGAEYRGELIRREQEMLPADVRAKLEAELTMFFDVLMGLGYEFGYRTAIEVMGFCSYHRLLLGSTWTFEKSFDAQIVQKILPRIHGSRRQIEGVLSALGTLCFEPRSLNRSALTALAIEAGNAPASSALARGTYVGRQAHYPLSADKIGRMLRRLARNGFTSFAEA
jgi:MoxR-like ATPase